MRTNKGGNVEKGDKQPTLFHKGLRQLKGLFGPLWSLVWVAFVLQALQEPWQAVSWHSSPSSILLPGSGPALISCPLESWTSSQLQSPCVAGVVCKAFWLWSCMYLLLLIHTMLDCAPSSGSYSNPAFV